MADINSLMILDDGTLTTNKTLMDCAVICGNLDHELARQALILGIFMGAVIVIAGIYLTRWIKNGRLQGDQP